MSAPAADVQGVVWGRRTHLIEKRKRTTVCGRKVPAGFVIRGDAPYVPDCLDCYRQDPRVREPLR